MNWKSRILVTLLPGTCLLAAGFALTHSEDQLEGGRRLFVELCASCHGLEARGDGPAAASLKKAPADLTRIKKEGERFPRARIRDVIDGEHVVNAHGSREMPVWGRLLRSESDYEKAQQKIHRLVLYLESIQGSDE